MKRPSKIILYPLDTKKDEDKGLWVRIPSWLVRAYRLHDYGTNMGKIKIIIREDKRAIAKYWKEQKSKEDYFKVNWCNKLRLEKRYERLKEQNSVNRSCAN